MRWRQAIAAELGITLDIMPGFLGGYGGDYMWTKDIPDYLIRPRWPSPEREPLVWLLSHSDCDGEISVEQQIPIARRLEEIIDGLAVHEGAGHIANWRDKTQAFIDGLRAANAAGEVVEFQ
jgi:hypothetical protein